MALDCAGGRRSGRNAPVIPQPQQALETALEVCETPHGGHCAALEDDELMHLGPRRVVHLK